MNSTATGWRPLDHLKPAQRAAETAARAKVEDVAHDFEALWLDRLMAAQRSTVNRNDLFDGGRGEEIFQAQLDGEFAKLASRGGGAISGLVRESLIRSLNGYATQAAAAAYGNAK
ncbi:MAG: rod-binding protein [Planctomycetes bacterium]|nr:rod-binding protein [Planctomycetota bacterium]